MLPLSLTPMLHPWGNGTREKKSIYKSYKYNYGLDRCSQEEAFQVRGFKACPFFYVCIYFYYVHSWAIVRRYSNKAFFFHLLTACLKGNRSVRRAEII